MTVTTKAESETNMSMKTSGKFLCNSPNAKKKADTEQNGVASVLTRIYRPKGTNNIS